MNSNVLSLESAGMVLRFALVVVHPDFLRGSNEAQ